MWFIVTLLNRVVAEKVNWLIVLKHVWQAIIYLKANIAPALTFSLCCFSQNVFEYLSKKGKLKTSPVGQLIAS